jgi:integration host factor subunit alpha
MTKADLADKLYEKIGLPKKEATSIVETLFDSMKNILSEGESIKITGFGTFLVRKKGSRKGRNPKTGDELEKRYNPIWELRQKRRSIQRSFFIK